MGIQQLYYTSCLRGLSGGAGFQTRATSPGLSLDERRQIEQRCLYQPPRDLVIPAGRTPREVAEARSRCPIAFRYFQLESGRPVVMCLSYVGPDYSGRWGNYFCHALVLETDEDSWPIDWVAWPGWKHHLEPEEDTEEEPAPLEELAQPVEAWKGYSIAALGVFVKQQDGQQHLASMVRCVFDYRETSRALVVRADPEAARTWLAAVQKIFPPNYRKQLEFSTFQADPGSCLAVNGTSGETNFLFDDTERDYQFYIFDFESGHHSQTPDKPGEFASTVARWLVEDPGQLEAFHDFLAHFSLDEIGDELVDFLRIYRIAEGQLSAASLGEDALNASFDLIDRYASNESFDTVLDLLAALANLVSEQRPEFHELLIRTLRDRAVSRGKAGHRLHVWRAWRRFLSDFLKGRHHDQTRVEASRTELLKVFPKGEPQLAEVLLEASFFRALGPELKTFGIPAGRVLVSHVCWALEVLNRRPIDQQSEFRGLLGPLLAATPDKKAMIVALCEDFLEPEVFADRRGAALWMLSQRAEGSRPGGPGDDDSKEAARALGRVLAPQLEALKNSQRLAFLEDLASQGEIEILLGEWEGRLDLVSDPVAAWEGYRNYELQRIPQLAENHGTEIARHVLRGLRGSAAWQLARRWIVDVPLFDSLGEELQSEILERVSESIGFASRRRAGRQELLQAAEQRGLALPPRLVLFRVLEAVEASPSRELKQEELDEVEAAIHRVLGAGGSEYGQFLEACLKPLLPRIRRWNRHEALLKAFWLANEQGRFRKVYERFLGREGGRSFEATHDAALLFWLHWSQGCNKHRIGAWSELEGKATRLLAKRLRRLDASGRAASLKRLERKVASAKAELGALWEDWKKEARPNWLQRKLSGE